MTQPSNPTCSPTPPSEPGAAAAADSSDQADQAAAAGPATPACREAASEAPDQVEVVRQRVAERVAELRAAAEATEALRRRSLTDLNNEAAAAAKAGDAVAAAATYALLFERAERLRLTHPELHLCYCNAAGVHLQLGLNEEAVQLAEKCRRVAEAALKRNPKAGATYVKAFLRKGHGLLGLGRHREAVGVFEEALKLDPLNPELKLGLQRANEGLVKDLVEGRGRETRALEYPQPSQRISYHPYAAPLHKIKTDDMLPVKLLTPFQAENDHHIKDTYNYATVQTDVRMPKRHMRFLEDSYLHARWGAGLAAAMEAIEAEDKDVRVLNLGAGAGLHAMMALRAGARHVTCAERWLYLALLCKEVLETNQFEEERYKVVYKRPTDLALHTDVPVCCNLLVANVLDEGLLTSGIVPAVTHALNNLLTTDAIVFPASATIYAQAVEVRTEGVAGFDMSAANLYRWHPAYAAGTPLDLDRIVPLSEPVEVWYFDLGSPPSRSDTKTVDLEFTRRGRFNAVMFWYKLHLAGDVYVSTGPEAVKEGLKSLQPALQYLAGELPVDSGMVLPLLATHNTVRMRFDLETADYLHLAKPEAAFPPYHFSMLADGAMYEAYGRAIARAVARTKQEHGEAHVLDMGCGSGLLAMLAARAGADSVVAADLCEPVCDVARKAVAAAGLSRRVSVVHRDAALLQRGREVRPLGVNLVVADLFDCGLMGDDFPYLLELARRRVVQPGAVVVPAAATLYCMGIEALTGEVGGFDFSPLDAYRWDAEYEAVRLHELPHRVLTRPAKVHEYFFDGERKGRGRDTLLKLEPVAEGTLNAVVFWFDLHLDNVETITSAPVGIGIGGAVLSELLDGPQPAGASGTAASAGATSGQAVEAPAASQGSAQAPAGTEAQAEAAGCAAGAERSGGGLPQQTPPAEGAGQLAAAAAAGGGFASCPTFQGRVPGHAFKLGPRELGYCVDELAAEEEGVGLEAEPTDSGEGLQQPQQEQGQQGPTAAEGGSPGPADTAAACGVGEPGSAAADQPAAQPGSQEGSTQGGPLPQHHWGQALQYLDRAVQVAPGRKVTLLAKRDGNKVRFGLRQGVGEWVGRAPWKIEWGGGASVENPHFQRVHYCHLLVNDFLMRVKSRRFPPIEKDFAMVLAHCGSLFLDPAALQQVCHELVLLERLHQGPEFSPGASLPALTKPPLQLH